MNRRTYLAAITAVGGGILAGCTSNADSGRSNNEGNSGGGTTANNGDTETKKSGSTPTATSTPTPTDTPSQTATPLSTPAPGKVEVTNAKLVERELEYGNVERAMTGLVTNTGSEPLRAPSVDIKFYGPDGAVLETGSAMIPVLNPGVSWSIYSSFYSSDDVVPVRGEIVPGEVETYRSELGVPETLKITEQELQTGTEPAIVGTLKNVSGSRLEYATVFGTFKAKNGHVVGGGTDLIESLGSGETWRFSIEFLALNEERAKSISDYTLYAYDGL